MRGKFLTIWLAVVLLAATVSVSADADLEFRFDPETDQWDAGTEQVIAVEVRSIADAAVLGGFQIDFAYDNTSSGAHLTGIDTDSFIASGEMSQDYSDDTDDGAGSVFRAINLIGGEDTGLAIDGEWTTLAELSFTVGAEPVYPVEVSVDLYAAFDPSYAFFESVWDGSLSFDGGSYSGAAVCDIGGIEYEAGATNPDNECQVCDPGRDPADWSLVADGTGCDDGLFCTTGDQCSSGTCDGETVDCDDGVSCTVDSCDEDGDTCVHEATDSLCDDGQWCDGTEICDPALGCRAGTPVDCDDGLFCTGVESCDEVDDWCVSAGDPCDGDEVCDESDDICEEPGGFCGTTRPGGDLGLALLLFATVALALRFRRRVR